MAKRNIKYKVVTETKGTLEFTELPNNTYFLSDVNGPEDAGKATLFTYDGSTCLIPIIDVKTGLQVCIKENAGKEIKNGKLKRA